MTFEELQKRAKQGDADAQYEVGMYYLREENPDVALGWLQKAAEQGHGWSFFRLNNIQEQRIKDEIEKWYLSLANQGNLNAQYYFGRFLEKCERYS